MLFICSRVESIKYLGVTIDCQLNREVNTELEPEEMTGWNSRAFYD